MKNKKMKIFLIIILVVAIMAFGILYFVKNNSNLSNNYNDVNNNSEVIDTTSDNYQNFQKCSEVFEQSRNKARELENVRLNVTKVTDNSNETKTENRIYLLADKIEVMYFDDFKDMNSSNFSISNFKTNKYYFVDNEYKEITIEDIDGEVSNDMSESRVPVLLYNNFSYKFEYNPNIEYKYQEDENYYIIETIENDTSNNMEITKELKILKSEKLLAELTIETKFNTTTENNNEDKVSQKVEYSFENVDISEFEEFDIDNYSDYKKINNK